MSKFAQHVSDDFHSFIKIQDLMGIIEFRKKGHYMNIVSKFYISKTDSKNQNNWPKV